MCYDNNENKTYDVNVVFWDKCEKKVSRNCIDSFEYENIWFIGHLLSLNPDKDAARKEFMSYFKHSNYNIRNLMSFWYLSILNKTNQEEIPDKSALLRIEFKLKSPYTSKDDDDFYVVTPIVKDKVFKVPIIRASTWKGILRHTSTNILKKEITATNWKEKREILFRLFGNEKENFEKYLDELIATIISRDKKISEEEINLGFKRYLKERKYITDFSEQFKGRLFFYTTFFDSISLDVITPLGRATKTPTKGPIYFEIVPKGSTGKLTVFYYPYDLISKSASDKQLKKEAEEDLIFLSKAIREALYTEGISAKSSSGYGQAYIPEGRENKRVEITQNIFSKEEKIEEEIKKILRGSNE